MSSNYYIYGGMIVDQLYNDVYKVGNLFQENKYQKIFMGESVQDTDLVVVINEFTKSEHIDTSFINILKKQLEHLLYFEEDDLTATFITQYSEGMSVFQIVDNVPNTANFRINLLHDYLNILKKYDGLLPAFQFILADHSQFFINDHNLIHNGLIIIEEDSFDPAMTFDTVKDRIAHFGQKILDFSPASGDAALILTFRGFFEDMESDVSLNSLEKIYAAYRKIYIYDMYLDKSNDTVAPIPVPIPIVTPASDTNVSTTATNIEATPPPKDIKLPFKDNKILLFNKEKYAVNPLYIALIIMAIAIGLFAIFTPLINKITDTDIPVASFEKEKTDNHWNFLNTSKTLGSDNKIEEVEWKVYSNDSLFNTFDTYNLSLQFTTEGIYKITLRIMDSFGNWSEEYSEEIYHTSIAYDPINDNEEATAPSGTEPLNSYTIQFEGNPTFDSEEFHNGDKSIKMTFAEDETNSVILDKVSLDNNTKISFWIKASDDSTLTISVIGSNYNDTVFSLSKVIHPKTDQWQKIEFNTNSTLIDNLKISINGDNLTLWLDDIEINSYK